MNTQISPSSMFAMGHALGLTPTQTQAVVNAAVKLVYAMSELGITTTLTSALKSIMIASRGLYNETSMHAELLLRFLDRAAWMQAIGEMLLRRDAELREQREKDPAPAPTKQFAYRGPRP